MIEHFPLTLVFVHRCLHYKHNPHTRRPYHTAEFALQCMKLHKIYHVTLRLRCLYVIIHCLRHGSYMYPLRSYLTIYIFFTIVPTINVNLSDLLHNVSTTDNQTTSWCDFHSWLYSVCSYDLKELNVCIGWHSCVQSLLGVVTGTYYIQCVWYYSINISF